MVGVYPIGTLVMLNTRELGLVCECNQANPSKPRVLVIVDSNGKRVQGKTVDLAEKDSNDNFVRTIAKTLDSSKYKINLAEYML